MNALIRPKEYYSTDTFRSEQDSIFLKTWQCVGFKRDLANDRDFITKEIGGLSVVVQNFEGNLRAFTNVCSHRFNRIQTDCKGNGPLQCAYHGWLYNGEGVPIGIPERPRFDGMTSERLISLKLKSWRVELCGDLVFICADTKAPTLAEYLGATFDFLESMANSCGELIDENIMVIQANWKVLVENTLESYHVGFVHPNTFARLATSQGDFEWDQPHSRWVTKLGPKFVERLGKLMHVFENRPLKFEGYIHQFLFPNLTLATTQGTSFSVQFFEPIDENSTRFTSVVFQTKLNGVRASGAATVDALNQSVKAFNRSVFNEDKVICEQVQIGARMTDQYGVLSDEELRVLDFQQRYKTQMKHL